MKEKIGNNEFQGMDRPTFFNTSGAISLGAASTFGVPEIMSAQKKNSGKKRFYGDTVLGGNTSALMRGYTFFGADHMFFGNDSPLSWSFSRRGRARSSYEIRGANEYN